MSARHLTARQIADALRRLPPCYRDSPDFHRVPILENMRMFDPRDNDISRPSTIPIITFRKEVFGEGRETWHEWVLAEDIKVPS